MLTRRTFLTVTASLPLVALTVRAATAAEPLVFSAGGAAIDGADPVAYFTDGAAVAGQEDITHEWNDATWRFSSVENREAFAANPEAYAPQYGGYCAYAVSQGYTAKIDPEAWTVHDGKLYLNFSKRVRRRWARDIPGHVAAGDANWPGVLNAS